MVFKDQYVLDAAGRVKASGHDVVLATFVPFLYLRDLGSHSFTASRDPPERTPDHYDRFAHVPPSLIANVQVHVRHNFLACCLS